MVKTSTPEDIWAEAFHKLKDDGSLHKDDLAQALELAGFISPDPEWIEHSLKSVTKFTLLKLEDFITFVREYIVKQHEAFAEAFRQCDADGSGYMDQEELASLLKSFGIEPMRHVMAEVIREVDEDDRGTLDLHEFECMMEIIRGREGFTLREFETLMDGFRRFDRDGTREIDTSELISLVNWLGYSWTQHELAPIVAEVDIDGSGCLKDREFLVCMRKVRDAEVKTIMQLMAEGDEDGSGTVSLHELQGILTSLGYYPNPQVVVETVREIGLEAANAELDLSELWQFLQVYRAREGLSTADAADIQEAFERYDRGKTNEITTLEVGKLLRYLGYPTSFEVQQHLIAKVDVDGSGKVDLQEVRKLVRMHLDEDMRELRLKFSGIDKDTQANGLISAEQARAALIHSGCDAVREIPTFTAEDIGNGFDATKPCVNFEVFLSVATRLKAAARKTFCANGGFSAADVLAMRRRFEKYDRDNSGDIGQKELIKLLEDIFPDMANNRLMRPQLMQVMSSADKDGSGTLDFHDFLLVMREMQDLQDQKRMEKELRAIGETGFATQEVAEFRELFLDRADSDGDMPLKQFFSMLRTVCPLGAKYSEQLSDIVRSIPGKAGMVDSGDESLDFPEFLLLMRKILVSNFANIQAAGPT